MGIADVPMMPMGGAVSPSAAVQEVSCFISFFLITYNEDIFYIWVGKKSWCFTNTVNDTEFIHMLKEIKKSNEENISADIGNDNKLCLI